MSGLHGKLTDVVFQTAWRRVRRRGAPGRDGVSAAAFAVRLEENLTHLRERVRSGKHQPGRLLHLSRRKSDGGVRMLGIPTIADRIAQTAVLLCATPVVDRALLAGVHGYRPRRSPQTAIRHLIGTVGSQPWLEILKTDIASMFDTLPHDQVQCAAEEAWRDPLWRVLCERWIRCWSTRPGQGLPQGAPLSPLLANLTLATMLDRHLEQPAAALRGAGVAGWIRYGDDIVVACVRRGGVLSVGRWIAGVLRGAGMALACQKTIIAQSNHPAPITILGVAVRLVRSGPLWTLRCDPMQGMRRMNEHMV